MRSLKKLLTVCVVGALTAALPVPVLPQDPPSQSPTIRTQVNLVNLFVTVRDKNKRIVTDLKQQDFKLAEDGQDQQIAFFSKEVTLPITLALLLDTSGSEQFMLGAIQDMGGRFLDRVLRKGDEALVMSFDTDVDLLSDFTDDRGQLDRAIRKTRINTPMSGGMINPGPVPTSHVTGTALYDAIYLACNEKLTTEAGRKAIVIVTDAQDEGSKVRLEEAIEHGHSHLAGGGPALRRKLRRGPQNHRGDGRADDRCQFREASVRGVRPNLRGAAQPVHPGLLSDESGARRQVPED